MSRDIAPFGVRMPAELKAELEEKAQQNGRSLNAEVVARLSSSLRNEVNREKELDALADSVEKLARSLEEALTNGKID